MAPPRDDDDRERPSWREIDQRRDGTRHRGPARPRVPKVQAELIRKQALAGQVDKRSRVEKQGFKGRLQVLALTSPHPEVRRVAEEILTKFE
jgi:hypothetical protein